MRSATFSWLNLRWPRAVEEKQVLATWRRLPALAGWPIVVEAIATGGQVRHRLGLPPGREAEVTRQLRAELPGLGVEPDSSPPIEPLGMAVELRFNTRRRSMLSSDLSSASRTVLTALSITRAGEVLVVQWILGQPLHPSATPSGNAPLHAETWSRLLLEIVLHTPPRPDGEPRRALATKQSEPGWRAVGRLAVRATTTSRQKHLLRQLAGAIRTLESPGLRLIVRQVSAAKVERAAVPHLWPLRLNALEVAAMSAWPVGTSAELPVSAIASRPLPPSRAIPESGRVVAEATFPGNERPLALDAKASRRPTWILGPTGSGKSTVMLHLVLQDLEAGLGGIVIEPKADLIADILARVPENRVGDVVVLDPTEKNRVPVVGLNPLVPMGRSPELVADQLLGLLHALYASYWGPRTQDILGAGLLTIAQVPGLSLVALPALLTDAGFRRRILSQIDDPFGVGPFWATLENWSEPERAAATAPALSRLRPFLMRRSLRVILGQARPRFDIGQVFTNRKVLLVNLAKGQLGPESASLLGSLVVGMAWQAALRRTAIPPERRRRVFLYADEFQEFLRLPVDLADAMVQSRALGLSLNIANQHLGQLPTDVRATTMANAQSKICFRLAPDDARVMAAGSSLDAEDFSGLGAYECYVQLVAAEAVQPWASARSLPPPPITIDPERVRAASRANYGVDPAVVDREIAELVRGGGSGHDDLRPKRRKASP